MRSELIIAIGIAGTAMLAGFLAVRISNAPPATTALRVPATVETSSARPRIKTPDEGQTEGDREARTDVAAGVLGWRTLGGWGYAGPAPDYVIVTTEQVLERDFAVRVKRTIAGSGCMPPVDEPYYRARDDAYNAVMKPLIVAKYGDDLFKLAEKRADDETRANQRAAGHKRRY